MGKFQLKRCVHDFNMAWRKLVPQKWRLRLTEDKGWYTLWNTERRVYVSPDADAVARTLELLCSIWEKEVPA